MKLIDNLNEVLIHALIEVENEVENITWFRNHENNEFHHAHGPSMVSSNGSCMYFVNDRSHNVDGPSQVCKGVPSTFHLNGQRLSEKEWEEQRYELLFA